MREQFILTEREKTQKYIGELLEGFTERERRTTPFELPKDARTQFKVSVEALSKRRYLEGIRVGLMLDGTLNVISPITSFTTKESPMELLFEQIIDSHTARYLESPWWKVLQQFLNFEHEQKLVLNYGFPDFQYKAGNLIVVAQWDKYQPQAAEKALRRIRRKFEELSLYPTLMATESFISGDYGILNKCFKHIEAAPLFNSIDFSTKEVLL